MCEANAYIVKDGQEELLMESVDVIEPEDDDRRYRLVSIFGEQKSIRGRISLMNLVDHKIFLKNTVKNP
ncbi:MAG: CooT family nickel-binding protein [Desulfobacteraceae bacterium]|nr:CooT family nickel-binding protein [Desulfobacteraceae bacterium]